MTVASIQYQFDVSGIDPYVGGGGPLPSGWYVMSITAMECKANQDATTGHNLAMQYTVQDGELKGRKMFENLNLWHKISTAAVEIAEKQLSSIGHAVGVLAGNDLAVLAEKPMLVELELVPQQPEKVNPNTGETIKERGPQNRIVQRKPATPENYALHIAGKPANSGPAPQINVAQQAAAATQAPAFNPAASAPAQAAAQQAPAFAASAPAAAAAAPANQAAPAAAVNGAAPAGGAATPPWLK